ncbi:MAG: helix-turn-helix transcriptional regulator [Phycisphaerae bacterium]|nr:helix-turn-helix transcriptional regulator [Phycisphaerae bacterium]
MRIARTPAERKELARVRQRFQAERPSLDDMVASGEASEPMPMGEFLDHRQAIRALRAIRQRLHLSLNQVAARSRMDKAAISRLENGQHPNPTVATMARYAAAIGARIVWNVTASGSSARPGGQEAREPRSPKAIANGRRKRRS